ncbi:MAG TPA: tail fiber protein [Rubricoccaceae bacterium]|jgi:microcystin-dependent protein
MRLFDRFRRPAPATSDRRAFFRRMSGAGLAVAAAGTLGADDAWAAVEERAARFGIVPGTRVDANGQPLQSARLGLDPFIGEIMIAGFNYAPRGYAFCSGQLLPINQNTALFSLLGTTYGGNGSTTFGLPDLRGRAPVGVGQGPGLGNYSMGQLGGTENTTLNATQMPQHLHALTGGLPVSSAPGTTADPIGGTLAQPASGIPQYVTTVPDGTGGILPLSPGTTAIAGGSQPFDNRDPFLVMNFCIATTGIFPSRP